MKLALVRLGSVGAETLASLERAQRVVVGTSTDCDVVVDREEYPTVSKLSFSIVCLSSLPAHHQFSTFKVTTMHSNGFPKTKKGGMILGALSLSTLFAPFALLF